MIALTEKNKWTFLKYVFKNNYTGYSLWFRISRRITNIYLMIRLLEALVFMEIHGNQSFYPICPKQLCSLFPTSIMLNICLIKISQHALDIFVSESVKERHYGRWRTANHCYTFISPCESLDQVTYITAPRHEKVCLRGCPTRWDSIRPVQIQTIPFSESHEISYIVTIVAILKASNDKHTDQTEMRTLIGAFFVHIWQQTMLSCRCSFGPHRDKTNNMANMGMYALYR